MGGGKEVKAKEIVQYYKSYMEIFKGNTMPEPKSMLEVTIEAHGLVSLASAKELYLASMESLCGGDKPYINDQVLDIEHTRIVDTAMAEFDSRKKLGGEEFSLKYRDQLLQEIEESYNNYKAHNDSKNIFKAANTPITKVDEQGTELATKQAMKRMNSVSAKSSPYMETK